MTRHHPATSLIFDDIKIMEYLIAILRFHSFLAIVERTNKKNGNNMYIIH
jgi:hypothetical protein